MLLKEVDSHQGFNLHYKGLIGFIFQIKKNIVMSVVCSELQEDYFLSSITTSLFTDVPDDNDLSQEDLSRKFITC